MGNKNNFLELNGKRYDAVTGELLAAAPKPVASTSHKRVDDIVRPAAAHHAPKQAPAAHPRIVSAAHPTPQPVHAVMDIVRSPKSHLAAHKPQHSKTLMRHTVHKPSDSLKRHIKPQIRTDVLAKAPLTTVLPKLSFHNVDPARLKRAERIAKSRLIRRFAPLQPVNMIGASAGMGGTPALSTPLPLPPQPKASHTSHVPASRSMDVFERALRHANSHEQPAVHPKKHAKTSTRRRKGVLGRRALSTTALVVAFLLVAGFIGLQNKANITMRLAAAKAGVHATLPGYKPSGFAVGKFTYSPGVVAVNFHSNSDSRSFNLSQKTSNWNSETLLDNYVATNSSDYQAFQDSGRTVYIYGNNNATWVNNGIWYQVTDNGALSTNQVLQLAQSM